MIRNVAVASAAALMLLSASAAAGADAPSLIAAAVADPGRPEADHQLDAVRRPAEVLQFAGVRRGMTVAELASGRGYYTRLLAKAVGPTGKVYAVVTAAQAARPNGLNALTAIMAAYPNVVMVRTETVPTLALPEKADLFWTTENYHDFHNGPTADIVGLDKAVWANLKPGGVFYVEDHSAAMGAGPDVTSKLHRMDEAIAKAELQNAGFRLEAEGDLLRSSADTRTGSIGDGGHFVTDRFMLKMRKVG